MKLNHIAIAVRDIEKSRLLFSTLTGAKAGEVTEVPDQKVNICFIETGSSRIELISPTEGNVGITKFLDKSGEGLHHICFGVENIEKTLADLKQKGFRLIDVEPRFGAQGHKIAFIHPESTGGVLIELEEE